MCHMRGIYRRHQAHLPVSTPRTVYRCAYHHKRGHVVCSNNVEIRQDLLDSAILHAMTEALDERVLEASVTAALQRLYTRR